MSIDDNARRLGEIYSQVIFELAEQLQIVDTIREDLDVLMSIHTQSRDFVSVMASPYFVNEHKKELLLMLFSGRLNELTLNCLMVAAGHNRMIFLPQIIEKYNELWEIYHGYSRVKVIVSKPMNNDEVEGLRNDISTAINSKAKLEVVVNPAIIGGVVIRYDSRVIDNTVKSRLQLAAKSLANRGKINEN
jgi:F-type H+-transporting ATPase subunit delta